MASLNIGEFKERIKVYKVNFLEDEQGGRREVLEEIGEFWAKMELKPGYEAIEAMRTQPKKRYKFWVIGNVEITEANVVEWNEKKLDVRGVGLAENVVELVCEEAAQ